MNDTIYRLLLIVITSVVTYLLRSFSFLAFGRGEKPPEIIVYIGKVISPAAIAMLVVYCYAIYFRDRPLCSNLWYGFSEIISGLVVIGLQLLFKNPLASIIVGVVLYMLLIQKVFPL